MSRRVAAALLVRNPARTAVLVQAYRREARVHLVGWCCAWRVRSVPARAGTGAGGVSGWWEFPIHGAACQRWHMAQCQTRYGVNRGDAACAAFVAAVAVSLLG